MAEISETVANFDSAAARERVREVQQTLAPRETRPAATRPEPSLGERSQEIRDARIQREQQLERFERTRAREANANGRAFNRVIDERGNEIAVERERREDIERLQEQRIRENAVERNQRVAEQRAQERAARIEQRIDEQIARERIERADFDPALPRGSVVDIQA